MKIDITGLLGACSYALDCVEAELTHVTTYHGKRVAYMSVCIAKCFGVEKDALQDLTACALLHDNALTQYIHEEFHNEVTPEAVEGITVGQLGSHCIYGEKNLEKYPFKTDMTGVILYHHENADGSGPFAKKWMETPLFARIIHLCDILDVFCQASEFDHRVWELAGAYLEKQRGKMFDEECVDAFFKCFSENDFMKLGEKNLEKHLWEMVSREKMELSFEQIQDLAGLFAKIIDYKSPFTSSHSLGVASCAAKVTEAMGYDEDTVQKMYLAGALHDIGKVVIGNEILEKPGRLTEEEFARMKNHAGCTYMILSRAEGLEDIRDWAAFHHEKLDGSGYPFGKTGEELNTQERIMACVDIYQALTEERPYKQGMSHEKACGILEDMVQKGWIDAEVTACIKKIYA